MEYTKLGGSGLEVSRIILGCMSYGASDKGSHAWSLGIEETRGFLRAAVESGITTFDTANVYSAGSSEDFLGRLLPEFARRDELVIATKVHGRMGSGPNGAGLSRGAILTQVDESLRRLRTDYLDLYQIHRYDPTVPIEETMEALHDLVRAGKVRYLGASSMPAWRFVQAQYVAHLGGWTRFISMQPQYNLVMREEEREMLPYCLDSGVGVIPWSPLARGRLTRDWDEETARTSSDDFGRTLYTQAEESDRRVASAVAAVAAERGIPRAQVALAWLLSRPAVTAPIVGATKPAHLADAVAAVDVQLTEDEVRRLEESYVPHRPVGF
ncbi:MAG: alcohol dehydrogenase [Naasia sp.]|jgi:aryl-alcohol dehydrogenase-like predicted oxidoreductase|uniref:aldo/keto reductase n=1 Tax=Naasia sp. TaxID=2546198 RepID=UPI00262A4116|nr:aldo/keto reductase [Naasia sp.]MCU1569742.1 alcohol dehydrogenase [Naasia sp.]